MEKNKAIRYSILCKYPFLLIILIALALQAKAGPVLYSINIDVTLNDNGSADIVDTRIMDIDEQGTECYIVINNMEGSFIKNFSVTDERGVEYVKMPYWNTGLSREEKNDHCGIIEKVDGYELCWGMGEEGPHTYTVRYTVTDVVRRYKDADGFNYMFVNQGLSPTPDEVTVVIRAPQLEGGLTKDNVKVWGFGYEGLCIIEDGAVKASTDYMSYESSVIVMIELEKGLLHPEMTEKMKFKKVRKNAFKDSKYEGPAWYEKLWRVIIDNPWLSLFWLLMGFGIIYTIVLGIYTKYQRKKMLKTVNWYRDIPLNGDLIHAKQLYSAFYFIFGVSTDNYVTAIVMRLIRTKALSIEQRPNNKGQITQCIVIGEYSETEHTQDDDIIRYLYEIFKKAAGKDEVLQHNELEVWMKDNKDDVMKLNEMLKKNITLHDAMAEMEDVKKVFGRKKFLQDFTLANERHAVEVTLWNDYLVYATLFGIADQVRADMKIINPDFLKIDDIAQSLNDETMLPMLVSSTITAANWVKSEVEREKRSNSDSGWGWSSGGGGGWSSFGGGGGFRGGGFGGGVR